MPSTDMAATGRDPALAATVRKQKQAKKADMELVTEADINAVAPIPFCPSTQICKHQT